MPLTFFSLEPGELGCTNLAKHKIRVVDNEPFKEQFQRIPPTMVEEVQTHVKEMLEAGALFALVRAYDVMQLCWCARKTDVCTFALTSISLMPGPRRIPIHFPRYMKLLKA